jgi:hypothetical protein
MLGRYISQHSHLLGGSAGALLPLSSTAAGLVAYQTNPISAGQRGLPTFDLKPTSLQSRIDQ